MGKAESVVCETFDFEERHRICKSRQLRCRMTRKIDCERWAVRLFEDIAIEV